MTVLDDALERIRTDPGFRARVADEPAAALREYPLGPDDLPVVEDAVRSDAPGAR